MADGDDPRVYFAAERTLLAWVRSAIAIIGLGFIVARFGWFLRSIAPPEAVHGHQPEVSLGIGLALVLLGTATSLLAGVQFTLFIRTLRAGELPKRWFLTFGSWIAGGLALTGLGLVVYLLL